MKFKHSEPLEVPPWKKRQRKEEGGEENGEDLWLWCRDITVGHSWLAGAASHWDPERFQNVCSAPQDTIFRAIPRQQSRTNWEEGGMEAEEKQKRQNHRENGKWMEREESGTEWKGERVLHRRGEQWEWQRSACYRFPVYTLQSHTYNGAHVRTHTASMTSSESGSGVRIWDRRGEFACYGHTHTHCCTSISGSSGSLAPLWTCLPLKAWQSFEEAYWKGTCAFMM